MKIKPMLMLTIAVISAGISFPIEKESEPSEPIVVRWDLNQKEGNKKFKPNYSFNYVLSNDVDCYVVNLDQFTKFGEGNIGDYLASGGAILINERDVSLKDIREGYSELDTMVGFFDSEFHTFGTALMVVGEEVNILSYVVEGSMRCENIDEITDEMKGKYLDDYKLWQTTINPNEVAQDIIDAVLIDKGNRGEKKEEEQKDYLGSSHVVGLVYDINGNSKELAASYRIDASIHQGQKYRDLNTGHQRGIYDIRTKFTVDAEPNYAILDYVAKISSPQEILDATYLESNVQKTYTLGGQLDFNGKEVGANVDFSYSYTGSTTSQEVHNDFPLYSDYRKWTSYPYDSPQYGDSYIIEPSMRVLLSENDTETMSATLSIDDMCIYTPGPIFMFMTPLITSNDLESHKQNLILSWKCNEEIN